MHYAEAISATALCHKTLFLIPYMIEIPVMMLQYDEVVKTACLHGKPETTGSSHALVFRCQRNKHISSAHS